MTTKISVTQPHAVFSPSCRRTFQVWMAALILLISQAVSAYELPGLNLGYTSFLDGLPPAGPRWLIQQYVQVYRNGRLKGPNGEDLRLPVTRGDSVELEKAQLDLTVILTQLMFQYYRPERPSVLGGKWGLGLTLPLTSLQLDPGDHEIITCNGSLLSDIVISPFVQIDPIKGANGLKVFQRIEFQLFLPTGDYDPGESVNPGANVFSFHPFWSGTAFLPSKWSLSWRLLYLWNAENPEPKSILDADDSQAGQAIYLNFAGAYELLPSRLRVGINGYALKQISDNRIDGREVPGGRERILGLGPGLVYHFSKQDHFFLNSYWEMGAENRTEGTRVTLRYVHLF
ncbi:SphA family protein [Thiocystis violacea]|uniref:SphA family protein n=1 Tax=Thiocystis violacea TaxID=13725 RepID=UPI001F5B33C1|nr:transporter [Thiocystis violacea]